MLIQPTTVRALPGYRLYLEFSDGEKGEVDLSDLAGKGVFEVWNDYSLFKQVRLATHRAIQWNDDLELCPDALYMQLTGKTPEELGFNVRGTRH